EVSSLPRATGPLGQPPSAIGVCVLIALPLSGRVFHVGTAIGQVHDFGSGSSARCCRGRKLSFVEVVNRYRHAADEHRFDSWHPGEVRISQQPVIILDGAEIVAPSVAMTLR